MRDDWPFWRRYVNLAQPRLGAAVLSVSDDFFGAVERLIQPTEPVFVPDKYDEHGKWMDGWESRRRRDDGHDWCVVRLGFAARLHGVDVDTRHFDGNQPLAAVVEAAVEEDPEEANWFDLVPRLELGPSASHPVAVECERPVRLLRLHIHPDGGVARFRVYGEGCGVAAARTALDLAAVEHGGSVVEASDEHFGAAPKLLLPGRGVDMGDGWETRRRRGPGYDWAIVRLGTPGTVERVVIDTAHFKGNYPEHASLQAASVEGEHDVASLVREAESWPELLPRQPLHMDAVHEFGDELADLGEVSHVRLNIFPDGGISRLRVLGRVGGRARPEGQTSS